MLDTDCRSRRLAVRSVRDGQKSDNSNRHTDLSLVEGKQDKNLSNECEDILENESRCYIVYTNPVAGVEI